MSVYLIKPLEKKSVQWVVEMFRQNDNDTVSWFTMRETYRWGQGFIEEDLDCNLPWKEDDIAYARTDCGWGCEFDDSIGIEWEFSDDITETEQQEIKESYYEGGAAWLFDGEHEWGVEDDQVVIYAPFEISLCEEDGTVIKKKVKLKSRPEPSNSWPYPTT
jgi:hypothetical protein